MGLQLESQEILLNAKAPRRIEEVKWSIRVVTGRVVEGKVVVEGERLDEGSTVTVFLPETDDEIQLSPEEEAKLAQALKEADERDFIEADAEQFVDELDRRL